LIDDDRFDQDAWDEHASDRMWPLDLALVAAAGLVLAIIFTRFRFDDPHWLYNAWTYVIAVPVITLALALLLRNLVSQNVQKSIQLGFLTSVFVHLTLLLVAVRWVIFPAYFPEAFMGVKAERKPIRKTVPEYVFEAPTESTVAPDWAKPVDAETASRVLPEQPRRLPPQDEVATKIEMPQPELPSDPMEQAFLKLREDPAQSQPRPADEPAKLARQPTRPPQPDPSLLDNPIAPETASAQSTPSDAAAPERSTETSLPGRDRLRSMPAADSLAALADLAPEPVPAAGGRPSPRMSLRQDSALPSVSDRSVVRSRDRRRSENGPVGVTPSAPTVAIAIERADDSRRLSPQPLPSAESSESRLQRSAMSSLAELPDVLPGRPLLAADDATPSSLLRDPRGSDRLPDLTDAGPRQPTRPSTRRAELGMGAVGTKIKIPGMAVADASAAAGGDEAARADIPRDRVGRQSESTRTNNAPDRSAAFAASQPIAIPSDVMAPLGPAGLSRRGSDSPGVIRDDDRPRVAALDLKSLPRPRRDVGGPVTPAGSQVTAVQPFNRRAMRTEAGAAPAPAGMVGPATEEAIELGLAYLSELQNDDGSWSLQGHGGDVILKSDTAATGMCLLAFQGAGYTHKQHRYAGVVAKGLQFLRSIQRTNGDLFRPEDSISNRNVALYSHGIAALAMSEAFGMTQDPELREPAQLALDYIVATQHRRRGGWRYTPQISADTSVTGWMMMALKSGELAGLDVEPSAYQGIERWLDFARESPDREDRYRYDPFAPDTPTQRHGRFVTPTMTSVGMLMRMYLGWRRDRPEMQSAAEYLLQYPPEIGTPTSPQRDTYYWYYATQVMFHMGGDHWERWNRSLNPVLLNGQIKRGPDTGSWDPDSPVPDRWAPHAGRLYVTAMNLLNLEVYYRHLPIYDDAAAD